jgi:hypothetical protein
MRLMMTPPDRLVRPGGIRGGGHLGGRKGGRPTVHPPYSHSKLYGDQGWGGLKPLSVRLDSSSSDSFQG